MPRLGTRPLVIVKELIDNGLDGAEENEIAPVIAVSISRLTGEIIVTDNGPGITTETIDGIIDYSVRVSSREAYPSPSRGRQGNGMKTLIAMGYVIDGNLGETVIEARGIAHRIQFRTDAIRQEPRVNCHRGPSTVKNGTRVRVHLPVTACGLLDDTDRFLPFVRTFTALNPHLAVSLDLNGERVIETQPTNPNWQKWRPSDPIPTHWHTPETLHRYAGACINADRERGARVRSVRDFVAGFRGLSGTAKQKAVLDEIGLFRAPLDDLFTDNRVDQAAIASLLTAMQRNSNPVKPQALGTIRKEHFHRVLIEGNGGHPASFKYHRIIDTDRAGLPFVVEAAFAAGDAAQIAGLNWSAGIVNPFRSLSAWQSLDGILAQQHVYNSDRVALAIHLACPVIQFTDRRKSRAALNPAQSRAIIRAIVTTTNPWADAHKSVLREIHRENRAMEREAERDAIEARKHQREIERQANAQEKAERAARRQARNEIVGTGPLYREIAAAAEAEGCPIAALYVLSQKHDPFAVDTREGHTNGQWFAEQVARFLPAEDEVHIRGMHYRIAPAADVRRPDGSPYVNNDDCSIWIEKNAAKAARILNYVPFEKIIDERNDPPTVILPPSDAHAHWSFADPLAILPESPTEPFRVSTRLRGLILPSIDDLIPQIDLIDFHRPQPYRLILFGEKSSLRPVLAPIARVFDAELILTTGESSYTRVFGMAHRAAADGRPAVVFYFSDFDPSGHQMARSVARKLQMHKYTHFPNLDIRMQRVALTVAQVRQYNLPEDEHRMCWTIGS